MKLNHSEIRHNIQEFIGVSPNPAFFGEKVDRSELARQLKDNLVDFDDEDLTAIADGIDYAYQSPE